MSTNESNQKINNFLSKTDQSIDRGFYSDRQQNQNNNYQHQNTLKHEKSKNGNEVLTAISPIYIETNSTDKAKYIRNSRIKVKKYF